MFKFISFHFFCVLTRRNVKNEINLIVFGVYRKSGDIYKDNIYLREKWVFLIGKFDNAKETIIVKSLAYSWDHRDEEYKKYRNNRNIC